MNQELAAYSLSDPLVEYNLKSIFLEKSYTKFNEDAIPRSFLKKIEIEHISASIF